MTEIITEVDYIAINTGYVERLIRSPGDDPDETEFSGITCYSEQYYNNPTYHDKHFWFPSVDNYGTNYSQFFKVVQICYKNYEKKHVIIRKYTKDNLEIFNESLVGSVIFKAKKGKLSMGQFVRLAKWMNIGFCGCFDPTIPYRTKLIKQDDKSILIVFYDCESG